MTNRLTSRSTAWRATLVVVLVLVTSLAAAPATAADPDYQIANGRFFTQTAASGNGYGVRNEGTDSSGNAIRFWSEFQRLGGITTLGYPISQRFVGPGGFTYQAFQRGILQWRPDQNAAVLTNLFRVASE